MCEDHERAIVVAEIFISSHKKFKYSELVKELQEKAGTTMFSPYRHISDYLDILVAEGELIKKGDYYIHPDQNE